MIRALIIDDEEQSRYTLADYLSKYCKKIELVGQGRSVAEGLEKIRTHKPDLIFLDVEMPDGTGFDLLENFKTPFFDVIFVTAFNHYAVKAFRFSALDYLLKPVDLEILKEAVNKIRESKKSKYLPRQLNLLKVSTNGFNKIALPSGNGIIFVNIDEIIRCQSDRNYSIFFLKNGDRIMVSKTLKEYEEILSSLRFYRIHHSHLINMSYVKKYVRGEGGSVIMEDGYEVEVARRRKEKFLEALFN